MMLLKGHCHCGNVRFHITSDVTEFTTCDCSLCTMRNAVMVKVPESDLDIISGQDCLSEYRWNTGIAQHFFCASCGIYVFHKKRAAPDHYGDNIKCFPDQDFAAIPVRKTEGANMTVIAKGRKAHWPGPEL